MTKFGVIIPICIIAASGCTLYDNPAGTTEPSIVSIPVGENEAGKALSEVKVAAKAESALEPVRSASVDEIRRLQMRLRELGFDPGPVDGLVGAKTKTAFARLQDACTKLEPLSEYIPIAANGMAGVPNRDRTLTLQSKLRSAGFDTGPVDGIFGYKTKSVTARLESGCFMAKDLNGRLEVAARTANDERTGAPSAATSKVSVGLQSTTVTVRNDAPKPLAVSEPARTQEEIRILQLRLRDAGFDPGPFDGVMGQKTKLAMEQYEASQRTRKTKASLSTITISGQY